MSKPERAFIVSLGEKTMTIKWNPPLLATGIPEIDAQHQEWIRCFNEFDNAVCQGRGMEIMDSTLDFFIKYAENHFKFEEAVMDELRCPAAEINRTDHESMKAILYGFKCYWVRHEITPVDIASLRLEMQEWLVNHIMTIDTKLRGC